MAQSTISVRMDEKTKHGFDDVCNELGLNMTAAITLFAKTMIRERRLPFDLTLDPFYSKSNMDALDESIAQLNSGQTVTMTLKQLDDAANE